MKSILKEFGTWVILTGQIEKKSPIYVYLYIIKAI